MTTALIKKMKNTLGLDRQTLKMLADTSRSDLSGVTILTEEQKRNAFYTTTSGVNVEKLTQYLCETFGDDHETPIKLDIYPLMLQQLCHNNSRDFAKSFDMDVCVGFNITACECGDFMSFEIHSVAVDKDGKYYDITEDFYGEKEKWFLPIATIPNKDLKTLLVRVRYMIGNNTGFCYSQNRHNCKKGEQQVGRNNLSKCYNPIRVGKIKPITEKKEVAELFNACEMFASVCVVMAD
jgi:hypothetical protein